MTVSTFIKLIHLLPNLNSLKISSFSMLHSNHLFNEEVDFLYSLSNRNTITKVYLERVQNFQYLPFLFNLCPQMEYLLIGCNSRHINDLVRFILITKNSNFICDLRRLDLNVQNTNDKTIEQLQTMICLEKLLYTYKIKRTYDKICIQWD